MFGIILGDPTSLHSNFFSLLALGHSDWKPRKYMSQNLLSGGFWFRVHQAEATEFEMPRETETIALHPIRRPPGLQQEMLCSSTASSWKLLVWCKGDLRSSLEVAWDPGSS